MFQCIFYTNRELTTTASKCVDQHTGEAHLNILFDQITSVFLWSDKSFCRQCQVATDVLEAESKTKANCCFSASESCM